MEKPTVLCARCENTVEYCLEHKICPDFPEKEYWWHYRNRWFEETMRFSGTDNIVRWLRFWNLIK